MRYQLKQIQCRPWTLSYLSIKLIESHYENNYGGALRRLNAITEQLGSLDFASTPGHVLNGLKREELVALNSTLLHELYFASMGGDGRATNGGADTLSDADRLRVALERNGWSQKRLAEAASTSQVTVSKIINGGSGVSAALVARVLAAAERS